MERFSATVVGQQLAGHRATAAIFSQNKVRIFVETEVGKDRVRYLVERMGSDAPEVPFDTLGTALDYAEDIQR